MIVGDHRAALVLVVSGRERVGHKVENQTKKKKQGSAATGLTHKVFWGFRDCETRGWAKELDGGSRMGRGEGLMPS